MTHQIFISSYRRDFQWLKYCLKSLEKFCQGFCDKPVVAVPEQDLPLASHLGGLAHFVPRPDVPGCGMMSAQRAMLQADIYCPRADIIHITGSDNFVLEEYVANDFVPGGKVVIYHRPYAAMPGKPIAGQHHVQNWAIGVKQLFGATPEFEYMCQKPSLYPSALFVETRRQIEAHSGGKKWFEYVQFADKTTFSEKNILGYVAHRLAPHLCHSVLESNYWGEGPKLGFIEYKRPMIAFWSWGGLDRPVTGYKTGETPRQIIERVLGEAVV